MAWWAWLVIGFLFMGAEMFLLDAAFYLVFLGLAGVITGFTVLSGVPIPEWAQWVLFAILSATTMVLFRERLYKKLRGEPIGFQEQVDGRHVTVLEAVGVGGRTRVEFRGSRWDAVNKGGSPLDANEQALIVKADGSLLEIRPLDDAVSEPASA
ncbi:MAG: NfeD family protein [Pseudomonadota bacterium]